MNLEQSFMTEVQHVIKIADMPDDMVSDAIEIAGVSSSMQTIVYRKH